MPNDPPKPVTPNYEIAIDEMLAAQTRLTQAWKDGQPLTVRLTHDEHVRDKHRSDIVKSIVRGNELERQLISVMASLSAAISLLEGGGRQAAPSDRMYYQMIADYKRRLDAARLAIMRERTN